MCSLRPSSARRARPRPSPGPRPQGALIKPVRLRVLCPSVLPCPPAGGFWGSRQMLHFRRCLCFTPIVGDKTCVSASQRKPGQGCRFLQWGSEARDSPPQELVFGVGGGNCHPHYLGLQCLWLAGHLFDVLGMDRRTLPLSLPPSFLPSGPAHVLSSCVLAGP